ncbi:unnamed protein product [Choristocarpus tenellus]
MDSRFPQLAAKIKAFVSQSEDEELILGTDMRPAERLAAHCLCLDEGLGHESRGEEPYKRLHIWKVGRR